MNYENALKQVDRYSQKVIEYLSKKDNLNEIGKITAISIAAYIVINKFYEGFFGPLSSLPGPSFTRFFHIPMIVLERPSGTAYQKLKKMHETYGDLVRLGPNTVSVADKDIAKSVLVTEDLPKGPIYKIFQGAGRINLFSSTDKTWHKNRRRLVSPAFSIKYLNSLEPFMSACTETLLKKIEREIEATKDASEYGIIDIWSLVQRLALDVIGETAFGQSFNMVETNDHFVPKAISDDMFSAAISSMYPLLSKFILKNGGKTNPKLEEFLKEIVEKRLADTSDEKRKDILQFLLDSQNSKNEEDRLTSEAIIAETVLFLIAGSETTSNTIGFAFYELLNNPKTLKKLREEIDSIQMEEGQRGVFHHDQLKHLPYLNAVVNETLRLDPVAAGALQRTTDRPFALGNIVIPANINVHINVYHLQTNPKYWTNPFKFIPERWVPGEPEYGQDNLEAFTPFSLGSRNCIGKNFALQEMRIAIATIMKYFDLQSIPSEMKDATVRRQFITQTIEKNSFKVKVKRRS